MKAKALIVVGAMLAQTAMAGVVKDARRFERKMPVKSQAQAYEDALAAIGEGMDGAAVANLAHSLGLTVKELEARSKNLFEGSAIPVGHAQGAQRIERPAQPMLAPVQQPVQAGVYDTSFDAPNTAQQQRAADSIEGEQLYRYALTIRNIGERKAVLQRAADLGHRDAAIELRFY